MGQGLEVYDVNGNLIIDSSVALSRLIATVTIPASLSGSLTGSITDAQFATQRIYYSVVNGLVPLEAFVRAKTPYGDRIHVQGIRIDIALNGATLTYTVTSLYGVTLNAPVYIYFGVY